MKKILPILLITFLAWLPATYAQLTLSGEEVVVCDNGTVSVSVSATNFIDITSAQFAITWNKNVLTYKSVSHNMPASALFPTMNIGNGELRFSWFDAIFPFGYTLPGSPAGSGVLFTITFDIVGGYALNNTTSINLGTSGGFVLEVANSGGVIPNGTIIINPGSVTIADNVPPVINCPSSIVTTAAEGQSSAVVTFPPPTVTDNCDSPAPVANSSPASGSSFPLGTTTVTSTVNDKANNTASCTFTVTVNPPPPNPNALIVTAENVSIDCGATTVNVPVTVKSFTNMVSAQFAITWDKTVLNYTGITDNINTLGHPVAIYNALNSNNGELRFSWFDSNSPPGEDLPENTVLFTIHFSIMNVNGFPATVSLGSLPGYVVEFANTGGLINPPNYSLNNSTITKAPDSQKPNIVCPGTVTVSINSECTATGVSIGLATASDNCTISPTITHNAPAVFPFGTTTVTWTATDASGNFETCAQTVIVTDNVKPTITCPSAVTTIINTGCTATGVLLGTATANDNCTASPGISNNAPAAFPLGSTTVTWTATDASGNAETCTQNVTVTDNVKPTITCPPAVSVITNNGCTATGVNLGTVTANDNCTASPVVSNNAPAAFPIGPTTVTWTATDASGNAETCTQLVTVTNNAVLSISCPPNVTAFTNSGCSATTVNLGSASYTNNCNGVINITNNAPSAFPIGNTTVIWTVSDGGGQTMSCTQEVTILDGTPPTFSNCPSNITIAVSSNSCSQSYSWTPPTASDDCSGPVSIISTHSPGFSFPVGSTVVTYTSTDAAGNSSTCSFTVTITDAENPTITCPSNITVNATPGNCTGIATWSATANDNCSTPTVTGSHTSGTSFPAGTTMVTLTATDAGGNTASCSFSVTVTDAGAPVINNCPKDTVITATTGQCSRVYSWVLPTATDACSPPVALTSTHNPGFSFPLGTTTVIYTTIDAAGNSSTCSFKVTVTDTQKPMLGACPPNIMVNAAANTCAAQATWTNPTATDNCTASPTVTSTPVSGSSFTVGVHSVKILATDASGNHDSCTFTVTVKDVQKPTFTCPQNVSQNAAPLATSAIVNGIGLSNLSDNCTLDTVYYSISGVTTGQGGNNASGRSFNLGISKVSYYIKDKSGNLDSCSFNVEIKPAVSVSVSCPANVTVNTETNQCSKVVNGIAATATPPANLKELSYTLSGATTGSGLNDASGKTFNLGSTTVTYKATANDNSFTTCSFTVKVEDKHGPVFSNCSATQTHTAPAGTCGLAFEGNLLPLATDNCAGLKTTYTPAAGSFLPVGKTTVTVVATDTSGNSSTCVVEVTVLDTEKPIISNCPKDTLLLTAFDRCDINYSWSEPIATDNCSGVALSKSHSPGALFPIGSSVVTYKATDASGNESTCAFTVRLEDKHNPLIFNMPANISVNAAPGECGANVSWQQPTASDICGIASFTGSATSGSFFNLGTHTVEYTAVDNYGNTSKAAFTIVVKDVKAPTFVCPSSLTVFLDGGGNDPSGFITQRVGIDCQSTALFFSDVKAIDDCGSVTVVRTEGRASGSAFPVGLSIQTYLATDNSGNQSTCSFGINVIPPAEAVAFTLPYSPCEGTEVTFSVNQYANASYFWTNPAGEKVANTRTFTQRDVTVGQNGVYSVSVELPSQCTLRSNIELKVSRNPEVSASANDLLCSGGNANLNLKAVASGSVGVTSWSWRYPNGNQINMQNPVVVNASVSNAGIYIVSGSSATGCSDSDTVNVVISKEPVMPPLFGTDADICKGEEVVLNGQSFNGNQVSYHWFAIPASGSGLTPINNSIVKVKPTAAGSFKYFYIVTVDGCKSDTAEWVINVEDTPNLVASVLGDTTCVNGTTSITLQETGGKALSWTWEGLGTGFYSNQKNPVIQNVTAANSGNYRVTGVSANGCSNSFVFPIKITNAPPAPALATNSPICKGGNIVLTTSPNYGADAFFNWSTTSPDPLPSGRPGMQNIILPVMTSGTFTYTFSAVVNNCESSVASVTIRVEEAPTLNISVEGETKCVSGTTPIRLKANSTNSITWKWTNSAGVTISTAETLLLNNATSAQSNIYTVVAKNSANCESKGDIQLLVTDALPQVTAGLESSPCAGSTLRFNVNPIPGASYVWKDPSGKSFSSMQSPVLTNISDAINGNYTVTASRDGCSSTSAPLIVTVITAPKAEADEIAVAYEQAKFFNVVTNDKLIGPFNLNVLMLPSSGKLEDQGSGAFTYTPNPKYRETDKMLYEVCYKECPLLCNIAQVNLNVRHSFDNCVITTVFSPNNDGINDEFIISCLEGGLFKDNTLVVYNQWGDKVYSASPYKNDWKGTYNGDDLPDGTYFYVFRKDATSPFEKGFVMIQR